MRPSDRSRLERRYLRDPPSPYGPATVASGLRGEDELVAVRPEVGGEDPPEVLLGRPVRRPVFVRQVEVGDPEIERPPQDRALPLERPVAAEVVPQAERDGRQEQPTPPRPSVL